VQQLVCFTCCRHQPLQRLLLCLLLLLLSVQCLLLLLLPLRMLLLLEVGVRMRVCAVVMVVASMLHGCRAHEF
jgi:hypothetical protein